MKMENGNIVAKDNRGSRRRAVSYVMTIGSSEGGLEGGGYVNGMHI